MSFIQVQRNRSKSGKELSYAHLAKSVWRGKNKPPKQDRIYLGRLDESGREIIISKGFPARFQEKIPLEKIKKMAADGKDVLAWLHEPPLGSVKDGDVPARVEIVGDAHVLLELSRGCGLDTLLSQSLGEADGVSLLSLAFQQVVDGRPLYLAGHWIEERSLPASMKGGNVAVPAVYGLMGRIGNDVDGRETFFREWVKKLDSPECLICDTTSISTYSENLSDAEFGHNRDDEDLPQLNLSLVLDKDGMPVWFRSTPGSIPDVSTLKFNCLMIEDLGLKAVSASLDRGFYSKANVLGMLREKIVFTIGVPFSVAQARTLVRKHKAALSSAKRSFQFNGRIVRHARDRWVVESDRERYELDAHIFFEPAAQAERMTRLEKTIFQTEDRAGKERFFRRGEALQWLSENAGSLSKCFSVRTSADGNIGIVRKPRAVALMGAHFGYTFVLTNKKNRAAEEVLTGYRSRDMAEKLFDCLKNEDGQHRLRTGVDENAEGRLFLAFISLILRASLEKKMRSAGLLKKMTTAEFFAQMRKIKAVFTKSGKRFMLEISKKNRDLLSLVDISIPS